MSHNASHALHRRRDLPTMPHFSYPSGRRPGIAARLVLDLQPSVPDAAPHDRSHRGRWQPLVRQQRSRKRLGRTHSGGRDHRILERPQTWRRLQESRRAQDATLVRDVGTTDGIGPLTPRAKSPVLRVQPQHQLLGIAPAQRQRLVHQQRNDGNRPHHADGRNQRILERLNPAPTCGEIAPGRMATWVR